jgi:phage baseplate assembly protein W
MAITRISRSFKDISLSFKRHPVTNDIVVLKNADAIKRSVRNLVQTIPTERFFNSTIGSEVKNLLFDNAPGFIDFGTSAIIEKQILTTIENYEPRVTNLEVNVDPRPDTNEFEVNIIFDIVGQSFPIQEFSFILKATR